MTDEKLEIKWLMQYLSYLAKKIRERDNDFIGISRIIIFKE